MNLKEIREILELLKGSDVSEFELGRGDTVLKLRRGPANVPVFLPAAADREANIPESLAETLSSVTGNEHKWAPIGH
jgi:hypothetical protein